MGVSSEKSSETSGVSHLARSEFRLLASQSHPNIVRVLDYGLAEDGLCYFTMELLRGRDFLTFSRKEPGRIDEVLKQVLEALDYIHQRGLVHLDLKPSNILVTLEENGSLVTKLVDFGLTRVGGVGSVEVSGTVEYLSPERIRGEPADARSDLYSLGVTLFENEEDLRRGDEALNAMSPAVDAGQRRANVEIYEVMHRRERN